MLCLLTDCNAVSSCPLIVAVVPVLYVGCAYLMLCLLTDCNALSSCPLIVAVVPVLYVGCTYLMLCLLTDCNALSSCPLIVAVVPVLYVGCSYLMLYLLTDCNALSSCPLWWLLHSQFLHHGQGIIWSGQYLTIAQFMFLFFHPQKVKDRGSHRLIDQA